MLVITSSVGMLDRVHSHTTHLHNMEPSGPEDSPQPEACQLYHALAPTWCILYRYHSGRGTAVYSGLAIC